MAAAIEPDAAGSFIDRLTSGAHSAVALIAGPGGGKTYTLARAAERARATGATVFEVTGSAARQRMLASLLPALSSNHNGRSTDATVAETLGIGRERAVLLFDDLHLADAEELRVLMAVCARLCSARMLVLAALRPWPRAGGRGWTGLARGGDAAVVDLPSLDSDATARILEAELGRAADTITVQRVHMLAAGNPLLVTQSARALVQAGSVPETEGELVSLISRTLASTADLLGIDGEQRRYLEAASVLGSHFRASVAHDVAGLEGSGHDALDALWDLGVLRQGPGRAVEFTSPLVQRTIYAQLTPPARSRLHARAFAALVRHGFERRAAEHAAQADLAGDDEAITLLSRVGRTELRAGAAARAAKRFRDAIDLASDRATPAMHLSLAEALTFSGNLQLAERTVERLLREDELHPRHRLEALRLLARSLEASGEWRAARHQAQIAAEFARMVDPAAEAAVLLNVALLSVRLGDAVSAGRSLERAGGLETNDALLGQAALAVAAVQALCGDIEAAATVSRDAIEVLKRSLPVGEGRPELASLALLCGLVLGSTEHEDDGEAFLALAVHVLGRHLPQGALAGLLAVHAHIQLRAGYLDAADKSATDAISAAADSPGQLPLAMAAHARVLFQRGRTDECRDACDAAERFLHATAAEDVIARAWLEGVRGGLALTAGRLEEAARHYRTLFATLHDSELMLPGIADWEILGLTSLVRAGEVDVAARFLERSDKGGSDSHPTPRALSLLTRALLAERDGRLEEAATLLQQAASHVRDSAAALDTLAVAWLQGGLLRRTGRDVESRRRCLPALREAQSRGALMLARLLESELVVTLSGRGRRPTPPGELTAGERRVVELAADGLSNREIAGQLWISINTVQTHLQRAYAKLGVTTRAQLGAQGASQRSDPAAPSREPHTPSQ